MDPKCTCATSTFFPHRQSKCMMKKKNKEEEVDEDAQNVKQEKETTDDDGGDEEDEGGGEGLAVIGALAAAGAIGMGAYYLLSGKKSEETTAAAMQATTADGEPVIDSTPPQDLTSVTAISGDIYKSQRCSCAMSTTFPHRVGKCLWKNILHGSPTNAEAQKVNTNDGGTVTANAVVVNDISLCAGTDITASMQISPLGTEEPSTPTTIPMNAIPSDDRRAAVPAAGAALPVADLLPDKGPTATSAVLHTPVAGDAADMVGVAPSHPSLAKPVLADSRSAGPAPSYCGGDEGGGAANADDNGFLEDYLEMLCVASSGGDGPAYASMQNTGNGNYPAPTPAVAYQMNHNGVNNPMIEMGLEEESGAGFDQQQQTFGYIDDDTISTLTFVDDTSSQSTQSTQFTFCQPVYR